jgi:hypothetical protein
MSAARSHLIHDAWPGSNVLAFMAVRIERGELTVACLVDTGAPLLCGGRVNLVMTEDQEVGPLLWPISGCTNGHRVADVERAFGLEADAIGRSPPGGEHDPVGTFIAALAREAAAVRLDRRALQLAIRRARHAA